LGKFPLPVEVVKMAYVPVQRKLDALGLNPHLRHEKGTDEPLLTDENNYILDCHCGPIFDLEKVSSEIRNIVGVVEHGLFLNMTSMCLVADDDGVVQQKHST
jgi:ribose 5-phosphate isomerase A